MELDLTHEVEDDLLKNLDIIDNQLKESIKLDIVQFIAFVSPVVISNMTVCGRRGDKNQDWTISEEDTTKGCKKCGRKYIRTNLFRKRTKKCGFHSSTEC